MAVYELTYKQYLGKLTPEWSRFLVVPRHALRDVFKSKLFTAFYVFCFLPLLVRSEEHTSELQSQSNLVCRLLLEKKNRFGPHSLELFTLRNNCCYSLTSALPPH